MAEGLRFEWNPAKNATNIRKHGISFAEASLAFRDPMMVSFPDPLFGEEEERWIGYGCLPNGRLLAIVYTDRGDRVRIISARNATESETKQWRTGNYEL